MKKRVVDLRFAKTKGYKNVLKAIEKTKKCPFCKENFKYHKNSILKKEEDWFITKSSWPYKDTQYHFLIIPEKHKENFEDLKPLDFKTVSMLANWAIKKYKIRGGGLMLRFGETDYTGSTVCHLHFHFIVPKINKNTKKAETVYFPIG